MSRLSGWQGGCACSCRVPGREAGAQGQWVPSPAAPRPPWGEGGSGRGAAMTKSRRMRRMTRTRWRETAEAGRTAEMRPATATTTAPPPRAREDGGRSPTHDAHHGQYSRNLDLREIGYY
jgi:hypothetical protein